MEDVHLQHLCSSNLATFTASASAATHYHHRCESPQHQYGRSINNCTMENVHPQSLCSCASRISQLSQLQHPIDPLVSTPLNTSVTAASAIARSGTYIFSRSERDNGSQLERRPGYLLTMERIPSTPYRKNDHGPVHEDREGTGCHKQGLPLEQ
jgi:hypothetical protein